MKYLLSCLLFMILVYYHCSATSIPVCLYLDSKGKGQVLRYHGETGGDSFIDYKEDGQCLRRASCPASIDLKIEECFDVKVTCENANTFVGKFPKCCVKC